MLEFEMTPVDTVQNAAVFLNGQKKMTRVTVTATTENVVIQNGTTGQEIQRYDILAVAKAGMAWDVTDGPNKYRLTAQQGCGCGGMKQYTEDAGYAGGFTPRGPAS